MVVMMMMVVVVVGVVVVVVVVVTMTMTRMTRMPAIRKANRSPATVFTVSDGHRMNLPIVFSSGQRPAAGAATVL